MKCSVVKVVTLLWIWRAAQGPQSCWFLQKTSWQLVHMHETLQVLRRRDLKPCQPCLEKTSLAARSDILAVLSTAVAVPLAKCCEMETGWDVGYLGHFPGMGSMSVALLQQFEVLQSLVAGRGGRALLIAWSWCSEVSDRMRHWPALPGQLGMESQAAAVPGQGWAERAAAAWSAGALGVTPHSTLLCLPLCFILCNSSQGGMPGRDTLACRLCSPLFSEKNNMQLL